MVMNFIAPKLSVEIVVGQGPVVRLHRTDRRKLVTIFIIQLSRQKYCIPFYLFRVLDECTEGIVLQQSNLVDSTVTLHLHLVFRNKRWNSLQVEQEAERTKKMLARFLINCESIVSQGVVYTVFSSCMWSSHVTGFSVDPPLTAHRLQVYV